jgi:xanthine/CO dehydrogenase XdhC/CoxF family maturation factor
MRDARAILAAAAQLRDAGEPFLVATLVTVSGSSYRRPGARLVFTASGRVAGNVSGGCLERDLIRTGAFRTRNGPVLVRYDSTDPEASEAALGCGGVVELLVERAEGHAADPLAFLAHGIASERRATLATVYRSTSTLVSVGTRWCMHEGGVLAAPAGLASHEAARRLFAEHPSLAAREHAEPRVVETADGRIEALVEPLLPPPHLFVFGAGLDVVPLAKVARMLGWNLTIWEASPSSAIRSRFAETDATFESDLDAVRTKIDGCDRAAVVVMGHSIPNDRAALRMALASRASYVGVLGPRHRTLSLVADTPALLDDPRVHAPVGLDLAAETPEEIALAISAEALAGIHGGSRESLRSRSDIHEKAAE